MQLCFAAANLALNFSAKKRQSSLKAEIEKPKYAASGSSSDESSDTTTLPSEKIAKSLSSSQKKKKTSQPPQLTVTKPPRPEIKTPASKKVVEMNFSERKEEQNEETFSGDFAMYVTRRLLKNLPS